MASSAIGTAASGGLRAALRPAYARILVAGGIVVAFFAALTFFDVGGLAVLWENAHWTAAAATAAAAAWVGVRTADQWARPVRRWAAVSLTLFLVAQLMWDAEVALGQAAFPSFADAVWLATVVPVFLAFRATIARELRAAERLAVYLDSAIVFWTIVAIFLQLGTGATRTDFVGQVLLIAYPSVFFGTAAACLVSAVASRAQPRLGGAWAILIGLLVFGVAQTVWAMAETADTPAGTPQNYAISLAILLVGYGAATWTNAAQVSVRYERVAQAIRLAAPLVGVALAAVVTVVSELDTNETNDRAIHATVAIVVICGAVRQAMLLRDRARVTDDLKVAHRGLLAALGDAETAAEREHRVADERGRVLAASQRLLTASDNPTALSEVLRLVVPDGITGFVSRWTDEGVAIRIIAATGPGTDHLLGQSAPITELPFSIASSADDVRLRAFSARGPAALPEGIGWTDPPFGTRDLRPAAALRLPLLDNAGRPLGALVLVDPTSERVLEPGFLEFARLTANQLAIALQNADLVGRLQARIEEIKRVQSQLIQASKLTAIGELAAAVAHEVNNPLTGVLGYADLLLAETSADDPSHESLEVIRTEALRARSVVWALLDFARPRAPERRPVDLIGLVRGAVDLARRIEGADVTFVADLAPLPLVALDEGAIQQVLLNLTTNACQAIVGKGTVTVTSRQDGDDAVITIADDGAGMTEEIRQRMFEPFFTTKPMQAGRGLGLSVSLGFVESHHGTISVASAPGVGTAVTVRLPIHAPLDLAASRDGDGWEGHSVGAPRSSDRQLELPVGDPAR